LGLHLEDQHKEAACVGRHGVGTCTWVISETLCMSMVAALQCFIRMNSNHWRGTITAITKVHCLCDVICCLAMDREGLQASLLCTDVRTLIKFHVVLDKSALRVLPVLKGKLRDKYSFI
jgi:hypothetical protein